MSDYLDEVKKLLKLIDPNLVRDKEDYLFLESMRARARVNGQCTQKQIFWLRDIKDKQLDRVEKD